MHVIDATVKAILSWFSAEHSSRQVEDGTKSPEAKAKLKVDAYSPRMLDADAYVRAALPLSKKTAFVSARLVENERVLALDFRDRERMCDALGRVNAFVENSGMRQLAGQDVHCASGYDFRLEDIAVFYERMQGEGRALTSGEDAMLKSLVGAGLLVRQGSDLFSQTDDALIAMSRDQGEAARRFLFFHEYSHALYFVDPDYRCDVALAWERLRADEKTFLRGMMMSSGYYASGEQWLMETETAAYSLAQNGHLSAISQLSMQSMMQCMTDSSMAGCDAMLEFKGDIHNLFQRLHQEHAELAFCKIPLYTNYAAAHLEGNFPDTCL